MADFTHARALLGEARNRRISGGPINSRMFWMLMTWAANARRRDTAAAVQLDLFGASRG